MGGALPPNDPLEADAIQLASLPRERGSFAEVLPPLTREARIKSLQSRSLISFLNFDLNIYEVLVSRSIFCRHARPHSDVDVYVKQPQADQPKLGQAHPPEVKATSWIERELIKNDRIGGGIVSEDNDVANAAWSNHWRQEFF